MRMRSHSAVVAVSLSLLGACAAFAQSSDWRSFGPPGGNILALAVDPRDSSTVYAGARGGVFKSTAGGAAWRR